MMETVWHLVWFFIVSTVVAYAVFLVAGSTIIRQAEADVNTVLVRDALAPGVHHLSGMVMVPRTCAQLTVRTRETETFTYEIAFGTWEEPNIECEEEPVPRRFTTVVFAPATGITFVGSFDGAPLPLVVYPVIGK
jgi:hypothetical protein